MKTVKNLGFAGLLALGTFGHAVAEDRVILRTNPTAIHNLESQFGLKVEKDLSNGQGTYLVRMPNLPGITQILGKHPAVSHVEANSKVIVPEAVAGGAIKFSLVPDPKNPGKYGTPVSQLAGTTTSDVSGKVMTALPSYGLYMAQPGITKINMPPSILSWTGHGVKVAVIDTWIDASNTVLNGSINTQLAYDTIGNTPGGASIQQETSPFIDQETSPFIDGTGTVMVNQETSPFIDQETSPFIDQETSPFIDGAAFGHGTMVAGLVHRVAPAAMLIPIRAFQNDGSGSMADVIQGIYYAVDVAKVDIISMSFSAPTDSSELKAAIQYAQKNGVICVAAVSNSNSGANVYPAAESGVIGVAATDYVDFKASFSDYGSDVELSAPGVSMTSTYPRDKTGKQHWAMSSGTSFAVPLVSGAAAVMKSLNYSAIDASNAAKFLDKAADPILDPVYRNQLGKGRLDVLGAAFLVKFGGN
jgi:subtilisin family serine protease